MLSQVQVRRRKGRAERRALVVTAHPNPESYCAAVTAAAVRGLERSGHTVEVLDLYALGFCAAMSSEERVAYLTDTPIVTDEVRASVEALLAARTLVVVYPTWWFGMPAVLKGWFERVLVPGVGFVLDPRTNKVRPGLRHLRRLVGITTSGSSRVSMGLFGDNGRRMLLRSVLLNTNLRCRPTWLALRGMDHIGDEERRRFLVRVERKLARA